jgi:hypothetical protein
MADAKAASPNNPFQKLDGYVDTLESNINSTRDTRLPALKSNVDALNNLYYYNTSRWGAGAAAARPLRSNPACRHCWPVDTLPTPPCPQQLQGPSGSRRVHQPDGHRAGHCHL